MSSHQARAALLIGFALLLSLVLARFGLKAFPVSGDEYSYQLQAEIFAQGKLAMPPPPAHARRHFEVDHVLVDSALRSKYPPGWPALLSVGAWLGATWAVNSVLGALTLALLFAIARRLVEPRAALIALALVAFSPFLLFNAASLHSHMSELFALVVSYYCLQRGWPRRSLPWAIAAGLAIGVAFLIRPRPPRPSCCCGWRRATWWPAVWRRWRWPA